MVKIFFFLATLICAVTLGSGEECPTINCVFEGKKCTDKAFCAWPNMCVDGKCVKSNVGSKCSAHSDCFGLADNVVCIDNVCKEIRALGDSCGGKTGECAPGMTCTAGVCVGAPEKASCQLPVNLETCKPGLVCSNMTCVRGQLPGDPCSDKKPCLQGTFCSDEFHVCLPSWSLRSGTPCSKMYADECTPTHVCAGPDPLSGTCKSLTKFPKAYEPCKSQKDCPAGSKCTCFLSGKTLCEYSEALVYTEDMNGLKRAFVECLLDNGCSTDVTHHILAAGAEWNCARKHCEKLLIQSTNAFHVAYSYVFGHCIDKTAFYGLEKTGGRSAGAKFGLAVMSLAIIGAVVGLAVGAYIYLKRKGNPFKSESQPLTH